MAFIEEDTPPPDGYVMSINNDTGKLIWVDPDGQNDLEWEVVGNMVAPAFDQGGFTTPDGHVQLYPPFEQGDYLAQEVVKVDELKISIRLHASEMEIRIEEDEYRLNTRSGCIGFITGFASARGYAHDRMASDVESMIEEAQVKGGWHTLALSKSNIGSEPKAPEPAELPMRKLKK